MNALVPFFWTVGWALLSQVLLFRFGVFWGPIWAILGLILDRVGVVLGVVLGLDSLNCFYASFGPCDLTMRLSDAINGSFWVVLPPRFAYVSPVVS